MAVIRVEAEDQVKSDRCAACGGTLWLVLGYVYADEEPHGIYYVEWCEGEHEPRCAFTTLSLGRYGEDSTGADRTAFCVESRCDGMRLCDEPVRDRPDFLGRFVPRDEALGRDDVDHLWHVADHIWTDDVHVFQVAAWLCGGLETALDEEPAPPDV